MNIPLRRYWDLLGEYLKMQNRRFALLVILMLGNIGLQLLNPQIVRAFLDAVTEGAETAQLTFTAFAFLLTSLVQQAVSVGATYVGENVAWTATNKLRADLVRHCLQLDMGFHNQRSPGELIERIDGDVTELSNFFSQVVVQVLGNLVLLCGIITVLFFEDWRLGTAFGLFAVVAVYALNRVRDIAVPYQKARRQANADLFGFLEEQFAGTEDIRSSGAVDFVRRGLYKLQYAIFRADYKAQWKGMWVDVTSGGVMTFGQVMAILLAFFLVTNGAITIGTGYLIIAYLDLLRRPIRELTRQIQNLQTIGASVERVEELRGIESVLQDGTGVSIPEAPLSLAFDGVSFAYHQDAPVLKDLTFRLRPRTVLGLLGRTGSGKTTLARLALRLYDPTGGRITLGETDVRDVRMKALRSRIGFVTQDVQLFQASLRDNLTFFDQTIPDARILDAIRDLELEEWYRSLPEGLDTQLETGGTGLSAGQAQLLALTRVFLHDPGLVILDEASSRLDPATEARIERAVDKLLEERTAIVIAHRLSTVHRADEVMILERGLICEHGDRERLEADPSSRFYSLLSSGLEEVLA
jgi:ATP-binding cassette subfamily B protein